MSFLEQLLGFSGRVTIGDVSVDASVSESHSVEADITEHAVEEGSDISDHYRTKPKTLQLECVVSSTPISTGFPGQTLITSIGSAITGADPVENAWATLNAYMDVGTLVTVSTSLQEYPDIAIVSLVATRNAKKGQVLSFSCSIKQLRIVSTEEAGAIKIPKTTTASKGKKPKGKKPPSEASPQKSQSALAKLADKGASFFGG